MPWREVQHCDAAKYVLVRSRNTYISYREFFWLIIELREKEGEPLDGN
jgi:hypothetical protein